jgi:hypothetical protein
MTPERAKEILPFVEAAARGKTLQYRTANGDQWMDHDDILFTAPIDQYRIKPEPREWIVRFYANRTATWEGPVPTFSDYIRVREILDEP